MQTHIRRWMLAYTIGFGLLSIAFVHNDIENRYNVVYVIEGICIALLVFAGNLIYSLDAITSNIRTIWKFIFPIVVLDFITAGIVDSIYGKHSQGHSAALSIFAWTVGVLLFFPTFRAHYKIGFGKESNDDVA